MTEPKKIASIEREQLGKKWNRAGLSKLSCLFVESCDFRDWVFNSEVHLASVCVNVRHATKKDMRPWLEFVFF